MKKRLFVICIVIMNLVLNAQTKADLSDVNLSEENKAHLKILIEKEAIRQSQIATYLSNHPNVKNKFVNSKGVTMQIRYIYNNKPIYISTENNSAAQATRTNALQPGGSLNLNLTGENMTVGVWDGGPIQMEHLEFSNSDDSASRITNIDNAVIDGDTGGVSNHATHVAGTIGAKGVVGEAKGMATSVKIKSYNWTNDNVEILLAINDTEAPIILSNHSYGVPIRQNDDSLIDPWIMGAYTSDAASIDLISKNNPQYLMVTSAGNSGNVTYTGGLFAGFDKLTTDKNAKNNLVVANANPSVAPFTFELTNLVINASSSQGPTDDLRIKPDIAADGTQLYSPISNGQYDTYSGTSMSAPNVTGTLILLQEYYEQLNSKFMLSSTIKALICHTAVDDILSIGPDPSFGWGFLNAFEAASLILKASNNEAVIAELSLANDTEYTYTFFAEAGQKLSATLCWTDMPGLAISEELNSSTPKLINDLDLRLSRDGETFFPYKLEYSQANGFSNSNVGDNFVDNIERIDIETPATGQYVLTVSHKGKLKGNVGGRFDPQSQDFSLVLSGNNVTLSSNTEDLINLNIWPNPADDYVNISLSNMLDSGNIKLSLFDIQGRLISKSNLGYNDFVLKNYKLKTSHLPEAIYVLKLSTNYKSVTQKIIIKR